MHIIKTLGSDDHPHQSDITTLVYIIQTICVPADQLLKIQSQLLYFKYLLLEWYICYQKPQPRVPMSCTTYRGCLPPFYLPIKLALSMVLLLPIIQLSNCQSSQYGQTQIWSAAADSPNSPPPGVGPPNTISPSVQYEPTRTHFWFAEAVPDNSPDTPQPPPSLSDQGDNQSFMTAGGDPGYAEQLSGPGFSYG
jgi:hypothetical protein